jgi:crotonobetaine/carnitine-CoA ligase
VTTDLIGNRTLPTLLDEHARLRPDKEALVFEDLAGGVRSWTYGALAEDTRRVAAGLAELGVRGGDKVVIHLANCPEMLLTVFALARLGAVAVPSNTANGARELRHVVTWSDAAFVVTAARFAEVFDEVGEAMAGVRAVVVAGGGARAGEIDFDRLLTAAPAGDGGPLDPEAPLEILFTSGTTAAPKGVVLTHANWLWSGERSSRTLLLDEHDRLLSGLPLFHVNAQSLTLMNALTLGATAIFLEQYSASRFLDQVRRHGATHISIVAMIVRTLLAQPARADDGDHALRRISYAINVSEAEKDAFESRFGVELINGYGLSEAMTEVTVCPVHGPKRWPSIGRPVFDRRIRIVDAHGGDVEPGGVGEIVVHGIPGRTIFKEYYKDPAATAEAIRDGWLHTGDNGRLDELGFLYFVDRAKDIIKRAGENISATEVEAVLLEHAAVVQAAVVGVPDPVRDEAVKAYVVRQPGSELDADDVVAHCEARLAAFKVPTVVEFLDALPTTSVGKVEKKALRALDSAPAR